MRDTPPPEALERKGGKLCLDFVNTVSWRLSNHPIESLHSYSDLLSWYQSAEVLTNEQASRLLAEANRNTDARKTAIFQQAIAFREALFRIFLAVIYADNVVEEDLRLLDSVHRAMRAHLQFVETSSRFILTWSGDTLSLEIPVWHIAQSAGDVLTSMELNRVSLCAGPECGWLFFDHSKNHSRKWCEGAGCGNRERVRRHYQKKQVRQNIPDVS